MVGFSKRSLSSDIDISAMREMRYNGYTNKQIADALGCNVSTVYRYIGKRSMDVQHCEEQNKPSPVKVEKVVEPIAKPAEDTPKKTEDVGLRPEWVGVVDVSEKSTLKLTKEVKILDFSGHLCDYHVNQLTGDMEMTNGVINGVMDKLSLQIFIRELQEIETMLN